MRTTEGFKMFGVSYAQVPRRTTPTLHIWGEHIDGWPWEEAMVCLIHHEERAPSQWEKVAGTHPGRKAQAVLEEFDR